MQIGLFMSFLFILVGFYARTKRTFQIVIVTFSLNAPESNPLLFLMCIPKIVRATCHSKTYLWDPKNL